MTIEENTTVTMVQTILDCWTHSQNDDQMVLDVARGAGLYPLDEAERELLKEHIGEHRLEDFERACANG